ncbi:cytochrome c oxidase subunit IV [Dichotomocladium elegans]|nr:cytochrome c oxidase subunit IV [Dichotomocladium elegans]
MSRRAISTAFSRRYASSVAIQDLKSRWATMSTAEQNTVAKQLEETQKADWKIMSMDDKKAAYYIAFGEHGPRKPLLEPGHTGKVLGGVAGVLAASLGLFLAIRAGAEETPRTMTKEWEQATNEYLREQKSNPINGVSSEGYKGKGYVR